MPNDLQEQLAAKDAEIALLKNRIAELERELFDTRLFLENEGETTPDKPESPGADRPVSGS